jgi:hypothetical protein
MALHDIFLPLSGSSWTGSSFLSSLLLLLRLLLQGDFTSYVSWSELFFCEEFSVSPGFSIVFAEH